MEKNDLDMIGEIALGRSFSFDLIEPDPKWTREKYLEAREKALDPIIRPLRKFTESKDCNIAAKANLYLAVARVLMDDESGADRYAAHALALAPREISVIDIAMKVRNAPGSDKFWEDHVRQHSSTRVWLQLAARHLRVNEFKDAERCLREGEKLDPKDKTVQLAKAALALKRGEASLAQAGRIIDSLERRTDEPAEKDGIFGKCDSPSFPDACRYLRAIHTALSGNWEQGRNRLYELAEEGVMPLVIGAAMQAFPQ